MLQAAAKLTARNATRAPKYCRQVLASLDNPSTSPVEKVRRAGAIQA